MLVELEGYDYSKIDLSNAYLQIKDREDDQKYLIINTHLELFKLNHLPFGISSSPVIFHNFITQLLSPVKGVSAYLDPMSHGPAITFLSLYI